MTNPVPVPTLPSFHPTVFEDGAVCPVTHASAPAPQQNILSSSSLPHDGHTLFEGVHGHGVFTLGTRNSKLAMVQTENVKKDLEKRWPGIEIRVYGMTTTGDNNQAQPLYLFGGKALWTKELEVALVDGSCDAIVHCLKDVPTSFPPGCELSSILEREDPSDALVVKAGLSYTSLDQMPDGSVIGTSSVRRVAQLRRAYPKLKFADVRGLVQTRLRKLDDPDGQYQAIILASAGLIRLGLQDRITARVTSPVLYHAVGQGALCIEIREGDERSREVVGSLECWKSGWMGRAERSMLAMLEGGCSVPVGAESSIEEIEETAAILAAEEQDLVKLALVNNNTAVSPAERPLFQTSSRSSSRSSTLRTGRSSPHPMVDDPHAARLTLTGTVTSLSGLTTVISTATAVVRSIAECEALGGRVAKDLIAKGADQILKELGRHVKEVQGEGSVIPLEPNNGVPTLPAGAFAKSDGRSSINQGPQKSTPVAIPSQAAAAADGGNRLQELGVGEQVASGREEQEFIERHIQQQQKTVFGSAEKCQRPAGW